MPWILICLIAAIAAKFRLPFSRSLSIPRKSFTPSFIVYTKHAAVDNDKLLITDMNLTTTIPTVRLENFPSAIKLIICSQERIIVSFYDQVIRAKAFQVWSDYKELAFLVGHEQGCNGSDEGTMLVYNMRMDPTNSDLVADYDHVDRDFVVDEWSAVVTEQEAPKFNSMFHREKTLNLNYDLRKFFKDKGDPGFSFMFQYLIHVQDFYTNGSITYQLSLQGHRKSLVSYKFKILGEFNATANAKLGVLPNQEITLFNTALLTIPMTPFSIPGVLVVGPAFTIQLGLVGFSDVELSMGFGFDLHLPIDYEISSKDMKSEPAHKASDKAFFNPHHSKFVLQTNASYIGGLVNVSPAFVFGIQVMTQPVLGIKGSFANQLGVIHRFKKATACPDINSIEIFHRHFIGASLTLFPVIWSWQFLDTGRKLLYASCKADAGRYSLPLSKFINASETEFRPLNK